jgi:hypothetical protein
MTGSPAPSICLRRVPWRTALVLLCTAGMWFGGSNRTLAAEVIQSSILVSVSPRMSVQAEGRDIRYGIYRDFPLTFKDANGVIREVDFTMISVERDDKPERYSTRREHGIVRIYAGDKDTIVSRGDHRAGLFRFLWLFRWRRRFWRRRGRRRRRRLVKSRARG